MTDPELDWHELAEREAKRVFEGRVVADVGNSKLRKGDIVLIERLGNATDTITVPRKTLATARDFLLYAPIWSEEGRKQIADKLTQLLGD